MVDVYLKIEPEKNIQKYHVETHEFINTVTAYSKTRMIQTGYIGHYCIIEKYYDNKKKNDEVNKKRLRLTENIVTSC